MGQCLQQDQPEAEQDKPKTAPKKDQQTYGSPTNDNESEPVEAKQAKLEDSNMAGHGSKEHRDLRKDAAGKEEAWVNMDRKVGIQIWRIEKFKVVEWPKKKYGAFYNGDSYIILHTMKDPDGDKLLYDVYFWLGAETTQDEAGTAAYKTVELDDFLADAPVQYREVQGNETKNFLTLFPKIKILQGGVDSGFKHVENEKFNHRLLHITGIGKSLQVFQVAVNVNSLNNSDSFILDCGEIVYQFNGNKASKDEKFRAGQIVGDIKGARGTCDSIIIDGLSDHSEDAMKFWGIIGASNDEVEDGDDGDEKRDYELVMQLVSNASGHMEVKEIQRGKTLDKSKLDTKDCFIIDGGAAVYVWCGKKSNKSEKNAAMTNAVNYLKSQGRDLNVPISRMIEGRENERFWNVFQGNVDGGRSTHGGVWRKLFG